MGKRENATYHKTKELAEDAQRKAIGSDGNYSETYGKGVYPCALVNKATGEKFDGFKSVTETYYG